MWGKKKKRREGKRKKKREGGGKGEIKIAFHTFCIGLFPYQIDKKKKGGRGGGGRGRKKGADKRPCNCSTGRTTT